MSRPQLTIHIIFLYFEFIKEGTFSALSAACCLCNANNSLAVVIPCNPALTRADGDSCAANTQISSYFATKSKYYY